MKMKKSSCREKARVFMFDKGVFMVFAVVLFFIVSVVRGELVELSVNIPEEASGNVLFISPDGDDANPGTDGSPRKSFPKALLELRAGDQLVLMPGEYDLSSRTIKVPSDVSGTAESPIVVKGRDGAVLKSAAGDERGRIEFTAGVKHLIFTKLEFSGVGVLAGTRSSNISLIECEFHSSELAPIHTWMANKLLIENCRFHSIGRSHGIYLSKGTTDVVVRGCTIHDTNVNGIHINSPQNERILVENNVFYKNSRNWGSCITMMGTRNITIRNNTFFNNLGHIFTITNKSKDAVERNIRIVHNTVYQPKGGRKGQVFVVRCPLNNVTVRNNIFVTNTRALCTAQGGAIVDSTDFDFNVYGKLTGKQMLDWDKEENGIFDADVRFVTFPGLPDQSADMRLKPGSPGVSGAPLLKELAPLDMQGEQRREGGSFGAFAR